MMKSKKVSALGLDLYKGGKKIDKKDNIVNLNFDSIDDMLFIKVDDHYRLIPMKLDLKRIYIEVTTDCNFACITCIRSSWHDCHTHMSEETFNALFERLKSMPSIESVHFGGFGEPMMHPKIFDMIKAIKGLGIKVEMITNGSYLSGENIERLIDLKLDKLYTSIDSPLEESFNDIRLGADFMSVTSNVEALQDKKKVLGIDYPALGIEFVAMKSNFDQLPKLIELAKELDASEIIVSNLIPYHDSMKDEIVYDMDDTVDMFGQTSVWAQVSNMQLRTERVCKFVSDKTLCINHEGFVSSCYPLMHEYDCYIYGREKHIHPCYIGNVKEQSFQEIWLDSGYINFKRTVEENRYPSCTDCRTQDGCTYTESNEMDCWGNSPSCGECLWARRIIACP